MRMQYREWKDMNVENNKKKKRLNKDEIMKNRPIRNNSEKIGRNSECFCGSGVKYKKCCLNKKVFSV